MQGVGKTTLIVKVYEALKSSYPNLKVQGFYTSNPLTLKSHSFELFSCAYNSGLDVYNVSFVFY